MKKILLAMFCLFNVNLANAQTIHFDDLVGDLSPVTDGYNGLNWNISNVTGVVDVNPFLIPGVDYTGINNNALFNANGFDGPNITILSSANGFNFDFLSGFWSAGLSGTADIYFEGYINNQLALTSATYNLTGTSVSPIALNWKGLDSFRIISTTSNVWIADNFEVNIQTSPVPEPSSAWLLSVGLIGMLTFRKKLLSIK
ncbi:MAG TPA: PEP-CTERM sorting domain-containing protein [Methylotenera sp.]|nr:PEP-CTERM sorting domain-containing protein [Methylotenera sp.]HPH06268.1 PEP-CTERM sorting domain-containing protein [Methylotenera sp.]HPN00386.1 PEP-CTERM sorting domain-containing protein [Methylotenera sp.]